MVSEAKEASYRVAFGKAAFGSGWEDLTLFGKGSALPPRMGRAFFLLPHQAFAPNDEIAG